MKGQRNAILNHLQTVGHITSKEAFELYGVTRLSGIIFVLRDMGYIIHSIMIDGKTRFGDSCKFAKYVYAGKMEDGVIIREDNTSV
jgi:hypothetical protein